MLEPQTLKEHIANLRIGARLRGVEITADGVLERSRGHYRLRLETGEALQLASIRQKVQLDTRRRRPAEVTSEERRAWRRIPALVGPGTSPGRVVGPLVRDPGGSLLLQVRQVYRFGSEPPPAQEITLGIDVTGPYGLGEPWLALRRALERMPVVKSAEANPDLRAGTGRIRLREPAVPDLGALAETIRGVGVGATLRGVEAVLDGTLLETNQQLALKSSPSGVVVPLAPLSRQVRQNHAGMAESFPSVAETKAYAALRSEWKSRSQTVRIAGRCTQEPRTRQWLFEVRRFAWHPLKPDDTLETEVDPPALAARQRTPDRTPPAPPANLVAELKNGVIRLDWDPNTEKDFYDYVVFRSTNSGRDYIQMSAGAPTNGYSLYPSERGVTYYFVVTAQDQWGNRSKPSREAAVSVPPR